MAEEMNSDEYPLLRGGMGLLLVKESLSSRKPSAVLGLRHRTIVRTRRR